MTFKQKLILSNLILITLPVALAIILFQSAGGVFADLFTVPHDFLDRYQRLGLLIALLFLLVPVAVSFAMTVAVMRGLLRSLNAIKLTVGRIRDGELNLRHEYTARDEFSEVFETLDLMRERLAESVNRRELVEQRKAEMIAHISHDLKTPITSIRGYVQGLLDGVADTPEKTRKYLLTIQSKAEELTRLADDLFLFSKLDAMRPGSNRSAGLTVRDVSSIDFADYIGGLLDEFEDINISFEYDRGLEFPVMLDAALFARVVRNIIENSIKYCRGKCVVNAAVRAQGGCAILSLTDNGPGVTDEKRIFESFYRDDIARTDPGSGSGLGLSIARQIVEAHDGKIWARTPRDGGLSIFVSLPMSSAEIPDDLKGVR